MFVFGQEATMTETKTTMTQTGNHPEQNPDAGHPAGSLPPFTDPAFSSKPASPAVRPDAPDRTAPPKDTEFAGHPDFSEEAAENRRPEDMESRD